MPGATPIPVRTREVAGRSVLIDRFGRPVTGVRISLTSSSGCNFRCVFCHSEGIYEEPELMTANEIERIMRVLCSFGVDAVKLTGGEPMLRPDIVEIVAKLRQLPLEEISMTTNGTRLVKLAKPLKEAGLSRVNISLHSSKKERFMLVTQTTRFEETLDAVAEAAAAGLTPVKLNMVVLRGVNHDEIEDMISLAAELGGGDRVILQLIELVSEGEAEKNSYYQTFHYDLADIERSLKKRAVRETVRDLHFRHRYLLSNGLWVEVVKPMHNTVFCMGNNRMRITYDGKFKPCLLRQDNHVDFLPAMRAGATDGELAQRFLRAVEAREPYFRAGRAAGSTQAIPTSCTD